MFWSENTLTVPECPSLKGTPAVMNIFDQKISWLSLKGTPADMNVLVRKYLDCPWMSFVKGNPGCYECSGQKIPRLSLNFTWWFKYGFEPVCSRSRAFSLANFVCAKSKLGYVTSLFCSEFIGFTLSTRVTSCIPVYVTHKQNGAAHKFQTAK